MNKIANVAADVDIAGPSPRRVSVPVIVGGVKVGGGAPIVVQSMTNTDTADVEAPSRRSRRWRAPAPRLVRITVDRDEAAAAVPHIRDRPRQARRQRAADRRLPLHRPQAARRSSGLRRGAGEVSHQSRQCRLQEQARHAVLRTSSRWRSSTARRCASAPTGARSIRNC